MDEDCSPCSAFQKRKNETTSKKQNKDFYLIAFKCTNTTNKTQFKIGTLWFLKYFPREKLFPEADHKIL